MAWRATLPGFVPPAGLRGQRAVLRGGRQLPNHHPDPSQPANLQDVIAALAHGDAELGLAFDGDGDQLGVVTKDGQIIYPDRQLLLFAADVLARNPGAKIIYDVKSTRNLAPVDSPARRRADHGAHRPQLYQGQMKETGAALAGEMSGHVFFKERWYGFDDGLYAGVRLLKSSPAPPTPAPC